MVTSGYLLAGSRSGFTSTFSPPLTYDNRGQHGSESAADCCLYLLHQDGRVCHGLLDLFR
jgi:hypothetical protein